MVESKSHWPNPSSSADLTHAGSSFDEDISFLDSSFSYQNLLYDTGYLNQSEESQTTIQTEQRESVATTPEPGQDETSSAFSWGLTDITDATFQALFHRTSPINFHEPSLDAWTPLIGPDGTTVQSLAPSNDSISLDGPLARSRNYSSYTSPTSLSYESANQDISAFQDDNSYASMTYDFAATNGLNQSQADTSPATAFSYAPSAPTASYAPSTATITQSNLTTNRKHNQNQNQNLQERTVEPRQPNNLKQKDRPQTSKAGGKRGPRCNKRLFCPADHCKFGLDGDKGPFTRRDNGKRHILSMHPGLKAPLIEK